MKEVVAVFLNFPLNFHFYFHFFLFSEIKFKKKKIVKIPFLLFEGMIPGVPVYQ